MPVVAAEAAALSAVVQDALDRSQPEPQFEDEHRLWRLLASGNRRTVGSIDQFFTENVKDGRGSYRVSGWIGHDILTYDSIRHAQQAKFTTGWSWMGTEVAYTTLAQAGANPYIKNNRIMVNVDTDSAEHKDILYNLMADIQEDDRLDWLEGMHRNIWGDGTVDPLMPPGIRAFILDNPAAAGTTAGLDRTLFPYWRNQARTVAAGNPIDLTGTSPADMPFLAEFDREQRVFKRVRGKPTHYFCGGLLHHYIKEEVRLGTDLQRRANAANFDAKTGEVQYGGVIFEHEPELDDLGLEWYHYGLNLKRGNGWVMKHLPGQFEFKVDPAHNDNQLVMKTGRGNHFGIGTRSLASNAVYQVVGK